MGFRKKAVAVLTAAALISATGAADAAATTGGHFTVGATHAILSGGAGGTHSTQWSIDGGTALQCSLESYTGTAAATTTTELTLTPSHAFCKTAGGEFNVTYKANGCAYVLKIGKKASSHNTMALSCPSGKTLEILHPNCTMKIPAQTFGTGAVYTAVSEGSKPALTVDVTASSAVQYEASICVFLGTNHTGSLSGSFLLTAKDVAGETVGLEATGTEEARIRVEASHTVLTGTDTAGSTLTFGALIGSVACSTATLSGTTTLAVSKEVTTSPVYSGCIASGREVTFHGNGCAYVLKVVESGGKGTASIECPAEKSIETTIDSFPGGCTVTVPAQAPGGTFDFKNEGSGTGRDLLLTWTLEGIHYTRDGCEVGGTGNNGTMAGSITLSGEDTSGNPKGIWIE